MTATRRARRDRARRGPTPGSAADPGLREYGLAVPLREALAHHG